MSLLRAAKRWWRGRGGQARYSAIQQAEHASALNAAISNLWVADGTHTRASFQQHIVPMYTTLLDVLKQHMPASDAETELLTLLEDTTAACHFRWTVRLPMKRPGSDYRKYEIIYTYALVTAMAAGRLQQHVADQQRTPAEWAQMILPEEGGVQLRSDPIVWEDWLGFFEQSERGGLYAVSQCRAPVQTTESSKVSGNVSAPPGQQKEADPPESPRAPKPGSVLLATIRDGLEEGALGFNNPGDPVQVDRQGRTFLEHPAVLQWCIERLDLDQDIKEAKKDFDKTRVYKRSAEGKQLYRGRLRARDPRLKGYVLEDASLIWPGEPPVGRFVIERVTEQR